MHFNPKDDFVRNSFCLYLISRESTQIRLRDAVLWTRSNLETSLETSMEGIVQRTKNCGICHDGQIPQFG
jgi:hypothetical protein